LKWLQLAAEQNCPDAQYLLGKFLALGKGAKGTQPEALRWLDLAAEQGCEEAKSLLATLRPAAVAETAKA
jgi:TPR repeat protein